MRIQTFLNGAPAAVLLAACGSSASNPPSPPSDPVRDMIFAAVEEDGTVAALDGKTGALVKTIDLSVASMGTMTKYDVHNVQAAPDGKTAWVTAMPSMPADAGPSMPMPDELVGIDTSSLAITKRISLGENQHPAHVVLDGTTAYVTAFDANALLVVDVAAGKLTKSVPLPANTKPHGLRMTPDHKTLVLAGMGAGTIVLVDVASLAITAIPLPAPAVQAAVLPDGSAAFVSIFRTMQVARLDLATRAVTLFDLPKGSVGPLQVYPTPDSKHVWVADQGNLEGRPAGNHIYRLNAATGATDLTVNVGSAPHGLVVNAQGTRLWATIVEDGTVDEIDATSGKVLVTTPVGTKPNGITCVHDDAAMP